MNPNLPDYIKLPYLIIKKKPLHEDQAALFSRFKEKSTNLQKMISFHEVLELLPKFSKFMKAMLNDTKQKLDNEHVNITEKCDTTLPEIMPQELKDPSKFTISYTIGLVKILHALCDLGSSINVIPLDKAREFNLGKIILSNMTITMSDLFVTYPHGILQDVLVHAEGLVFPIDFIVVNMKGDTGGSVFLRCPFLETEKVLIDVEIGELRLKFNKEKVVSNVYEWTPYVDD